MGEVISSSQSFTQTRQELVKVPAFFSFRSHSLVSVAILSTFLYVNDS